MIEVVPGIPRLVSWQLNSLTLSSWRRWIWLTNKPLFLNYQNWGSLVYLDGFPWWCSGKDSVCQCRRQKGLGFDLWVSKIPWRRKWQPTPVFLPGKSCGQKSLVGYSLRGCKESNTSEHACTTYTRYNWLFLNSGILELHHLFWEENILCSLVHVHHQLDKHTFVWVTEALFPFSYPKLKYMFWQ